MHNGVLPTWWHCTPSLESSSSVRSPLHGIRSGCRKRGKVQCLGKEGFPIDFASREHWNEDNSQVWVKLLDWCPMVKVLNYDWMAKNSTHISSSFWLSAVAFSSCNYCFKPRYGFDPPPGASMCMAALQPVACFFFSAWQVQASQATTAAVQCHVCSNVKCSTGPNSTHSLSQQFQLAEPSFHRFTHQPPLQYPRLISQQITPWDNALHKLLKALPRVPLQWQVR